MTTITLRHLSVPRESLDITIAAHISGNWIPSNITGSVTPVIECLSFLPSMNIEEDNQSGANIIRTSVTNRYREDTSEEPNGDDAHGWLTDIQIDIWAESVKLLQQFEDEVNRILWSVRPNESTRLFKSNNAGTNPPVIGSTNSEIESFKDTEITFEFLGSQGEGISQIVSSQGVLTCRWFKLKS